MPLSPGRRALGKSAVRRLAVRAGLELIAASKAQRLRPAASGRGVIFTLHHVRPHTDGGSPNALLSITPDFLEEAILSARDSGLQPLALADLPERLADPADHRRYVCFTLDDGCRDNAVHAAPVFRRHGMPYTIFVTRGFVERTRTMWWETAEALVARVDRLAFDFGFGEEEVACASRAGKLHAFQRLAEAVAALDENEAVARIDAAARGAGIEPMAIVEREIMDADELRRLAPDPLCSLGAHTLTHRNVARLDDAALAEELSGSADAVEGWTGRRPSTFAYPYGYAAAVSPRAEAAVRAAGFSLAVTTQPGVLGRGCLERPAAVPRVSLNGHFQKARYVRALMSGLAFRRSS